MTTTDVVVVGAGPSGTFLALLLGQAGLSCILLEKRTEPPTSSMAIGVMPPTLHRLQRINLAEAVVQAGCQVGRAGVMAGRNLLGTLDLGSLSPPFNYVLSIPQCDLISILRDKLPAWPTSQLRLGQDVQSITQTAKGVCVAINGAPSLTARFVVACDGHRSPTRTSAGIPFEGGNYAQSFMMGDFPESTSWHGEARLIFTPDGSIESFPLPRAQRRWVIQSNSPQPDTDTIARRITAVTGHPLDTSQARDITTFTPARRLCRSYFKNRVILCGDAAHVMSPIGGQGMNTGMADAWHLAAVLIQLCRTGEAPEPLLTRYDQCRRQAYLIASNRAARGMWLGTLKGQVADGLRSLLIRDILFGSSLRNHLAPYFTMLTIPDEDPMHGWPGAGAKS